MKDLEQLLSKKGAKPLQLKYVYTINCVKHVVLFIILGIKSNKMSINHSI